MGAWMLMLALSNALAAGADAGSPARAKSNGIAWTEFDPIVIAPYARPDAPVLLRAFADGAPDRLELQLRGGRAVILRDDGEDADARAGDNLYSAWLRAADLLERNSPGRAGRPILGELRAYAGQQASLALNLIGEVAPEDLPAYPILRRGKGAAAMHRTSHVANYVDAQYHADRSIPRGIARGLALLGDHYDFVDLVSVQRRYTENRHHAVVRNTVAGIGLQRFDAGGQYGSAARLIGYTVFPSLGFYDPQAHAYSHELGHQWLNFQQGPLDDTQGSHWPVGPLAHGIMGTSGEGGVGLDLSCALTRNGATIEVAREPNHARFGEWELYFMGLLPAAEVPPTWTFTDQAQARQLLFRQDWCRRPLQNAVTQVRIEDAIAANGPRVPAEGPRVFRLATLAVSADRLLSNHELRYLTWLARRGESTKSMRSATGLGTEDGLTFEMATGARARIDPRLDAVGADGFE